MLLNPRRVKYRKTQKGKNRGISTRGEKLIFGEFGLKALQNGMIKGNHLEACRVGITRKLRGAGRLWVTVFPWKPVTKKPAETRMGKGKGDPDHWACPVRRGKIIFELGGIPEELARQVFRLAAFKLPLKTKFITRAAH